MRNNLTACFRAVRRPTSPELHRHFSSAMSSNNMSARTTNHGDLNNSEVLRPHVHSPLDATYLRRSLAISEAEDDAAIRANYRPFLLSDDAAQSDWISKLELSTTLKMAEAEMSSPDRGRLKILVLYGSLRKRSFSRLLAFEQARILFRLGCDVRVYDPVGLPVKDDVQHEHAKVQELRSLSRWSDGHLWVSPEQHGVLTAVFKNQIDWIPLSSGSVRPTQGRTLAVSQVSGGSQSFNTVNALRILGRWMRMFVIPNQSSVPKAYEQFTPAADPEAGEGNRMLPSGNRDRVVDCMEEFVKYTIIMRRHFDLFSDRFSERIEQKAERLAGATIANAAVADSTRGGDMINSVRLDVI